MSEYNNPPLLESSDNYQLDDKTPDLSTNFFSGLDLINMGTESIPMLFENLIPQVGVWALIGASDTGKSMALRQIALCVAGGQSFIDIKCNAVHKRAIVVCTEDDELAISFLIRKQNKSIGLENDHLLNIKFLFDTLNLIEALQLELEKNPADLIVIDAFSDVFDGKDSNQNAQVRQFLNKFTQLANKYKCSIGFLHHTGKRTEDLSPSKNNAIGSQGFEAKMRLVVEMRLDKSTPELRHFCVVKGNYLPQEQKNSSIVISMDENLTFANTGERKDFDSINENTGNSKKIEPSNFENDIHYRCIRYILPKNKRYSQNNLNIKIRDYFERLGSGFSERIGRRFIEYYENQIWIVDEATNSKSSSYRNNLPD